MLNHAKDTLKNIIIKFNYYIFEIEIEIEIYLNLNDKNE